LFGGRLLIHSFVLLCLQLLKCVLSDYVGVIGLNGSEGRVFDDS
jgi:hypothetical protein